MAKIENWTRQKNKETKITPYIWQHKSGDEEVVITKDSMIYGEREDWILEQNNTKYREASEMGIGTNKEKLRKQAVKRMKNNPLGFDDTTKNMYKPSVDIKDLSAAVVNDKPRDYNFYDNEYPTDWDIPLRLTEEERMNGYFEPMMNTAWPLPSNFTIPDGAKEDLVNMTIVNIKDERGYDLALTGAGMDFSWQIAETYVNLGFLPPAHIQRLPKMAGKNYDSEINRMIMKALKKSHEVASTQSQRAIEDLNEMMR